ncbi:hypothetical protein AT575_05465 [Streptococcus penaeicida]|uniref:Lipoprotein n=1 Tax=Streptococcus penaeicida TaxID=1765960 RepID=A0A2N8LC37_9STRE|nr:hypothetical protein [Streptococcus penaeicida]PND47716.1 hypothetical protein AT575_05465 [Streptococcus penaeicida]
MKKKIMISAVVLTLACSSILCLGQDQESAQEQFNNKAIPVSHQKAASKAVVKDSQKVDGKKATISSLQNNISLPQEEHGVTAQGSENQTLNSDTVSQANAVSEKSSKASSQVISEASLSDGSVTKAQTNASAETNTTSQSQEVVANTVVTPTLLPIPAALVGTWTVQPDTDWLVTITISADGTVTRVDKSSGYVRYAQAQTAYFNGVYDRGNGYYELVGNNGYNQAIMIPGGIGGANIKYTFGFQLQGTSLLPVLWQTGINSEFDYSYPLGGSSLVKQ